MKKSANHSGIGLPISVDTLAQAVDKTNEYLVILPNAFKTGGLEFYRILNQRNLSGFVGEIFKHAVCSVESTFQPNPHPDGRPDLLDLSNKKAKLYFEAQCFESETKAPIRKRLAPFKFGGIEIKCTIGSIENASSMPIGTPRVDQVRGINYWAHHVHDCDLLGIYYDFCSKKEGLPQIKGVFFAKIRDADWHRVSTGDPTKKKTSNTSLNARGVAKLYGGLVLYDDSAPYKGMLERLGISM